MTEEEQKPMEIFLLIVEDRHCDVEAVPFLSKEGAIEEADRRARDYMARWKYDEPEYRKLEHQLDSEGDEDWVFDISVSEDGLKARVVRCEVQP